MKKWMAFAVLVLGLSVLTSGGVRPEGAEAYNRGVHQTITKYARQLWSNAEILQHADWIDAGASNEDLKDHVWDYYGTNGECITITHFWDPDNGIGDIMHTAFCNGQNAAWKAQILWGMALGEYHSGDKDQAYEYLGHIAHLLADMTVPAHAHDDSHVYDDTFDDEYMNWGNSCSPPTEQGNECLSYDELNGLIAAGPVEVPDGPVLPLYWLFYTTAQIGDFYASDDDYGDSNDPYFNPPLVNFSALEDIPEFNDPSKVDGCDWEEEGSLCKTYMEIIRRNSYFHSIPAVAALYKLFEETAKQQAELTVVIDSIQQLQGHGDDPDYFVRVGIGGFWFRNEGVQAEDTGYDPIYPGWAFAQNVGLTGATTVEIELWDDDGGNDDFSDIDPRDDDRGLALTVNLNMCVAGEAGAVSGDLGGNCGDQLISEGAEADASRIWFHIIAPNAPPVAEAGPVQTVDEGDLVTLNGSFTDPNADDTHTFLWHLESSTNGQAVPNATTQPMSFTPVDNGIYTFSFTVTDNHGASGSDTVVVTAENVPPVAGIDSITDETGARIGVDVPVALVGLEVDLAGSFTDVGTVDTHSAEINWGDGNTDTVFDAFGDCLGGVTGTLSDAHIYAAPGIYTITLNVMDDDGGVGTATTQIEVVDAAGAIAEVVESLAPLADAPDIQAAIDKLQGEQGGDASNGAIDKLEQGNPNAALEKIKQALGYLEAAEAADPSLDLTYDKGLLALAGKSVAVGAIEEAEAVAVKPNDLLKIQQAKDLVAQADALLAAHDYVGTVDKDQQAVREVQNIR